MQASDEPLTIAEISVTLIGFSGLISVFRSRDGSELEVRDLSALAMIIVSRAIALLFSLLPFPLIYLQLSEATVWSISAGLFAMVTAVAMATFGVLNHRRRKAGHAERTPRLNLSTQITGGVTVLALVGSSAGVLPPGPAIYLLALMTCLVLSLWFVGIMLVVGRQPPAAHAE